MGKSKEKYKPALPHVAQSTCERIPTPYKRKLVKQWFKLRPKLGSAGAARAMGRNDSQLGGWARQLGMIPPRIEWDRKKVGEKMNGANA